MGQRSSTIFLRAFCTDDTDRFAVATVMLTTTFLIALQFKYVKGWPAVLGIVFFFIFGFFDGEQKKYDTSFPL